jgi:hypothetical protein
VRFALIPAVTLLVACHAATAHRPIALFQARVVELDAAFRCQHIPPADGAGAPEEWGYGCHKAVVAEVVWPPAWRGRKFMGVCSAVRKEWWTLGAVVSFVANERRLARGEVIPRHGVCEELP